jgi:2-polyprenyl-3-methyl-5-hydroxy-6-metoxy-1,4-benzoquinol methylase
VTVDEDTRSQVRDSARYLRNVRPVDPEEVHEYVEGQPHPAVVRQVLREEAPDLGLVERDDGRFEPVPDGPLNPEFRGVEALPEAYARELSDRLVERFGPDWHRGDSGDELRAAIRDLKEDYLHGTAVEYDEVAALGYAVYHLPDYYAAVQYAVDELGRLGLLDHDLRVLEVGAGVGGPMLGLADYVGEDALLDYHAVEPSDAADVLAGMAAATGPNVHVDVHRTTAEAFDPDGPYDLVLFANVLSELADPVGVARRYLDSVADGGAFVALAPADRETSIGLREVERALAADATVFSPTLRLWPDGEPSDRGWSFAVQDDLAVPPVQRKLDDAGGGTGEFVNVDVQYSHAILRPDGERRLDVGADPDRHARMADADDYVTERMDLLAVKLSHDLSEGDNPLFKVSDGSESVGHFAVLTRETSLNRGLREAAYGDVLSFESALALWNDDEAAYNLVVDDETIVDRIPAP